MINRKYILTFALLLILLPMITGVEVPLFKQGIDNTLVVPVFENDIDLCTTCSCNVSIDAPNGTILARDDPTNFTGNHASYNLNGSQIGTLGIHKGDIYCTNGVDSGASTFKYNVTPSGEETSSSQALVYILVMMLSIFLFTLTAFGTLKVRWGDFRTPEGDIIGINNFKFLKLLFFVLSHLILIFIFFMADILTRKYLYITTASLFFNFIYKFLIGLLYPSIILGVLFIVVVFLQDQKVQKAIIRGIPLR